MSEQKTFKGIPWYIRFLLWFKPSVYGLDVESDEEMYYVKTKQLFGVIYVLEEGRLKC